MSILSDLNSPVLRSTLRATNAWMHLLSPVLRLRLLVRRSEIWLVAIATVIGVAAGLAQAAISTAAHGLQRLLFGLGPDERLSAATGTFGLWALGVPLVGGLLLVPVAYLVKRKGRRMVDPIEANALHGGHLSFKDSLVITLQTIISNGFGASVGLEAAYAQMGGAFGSKLSAFLHARRSDMRLLLGCGAGAAIAAAFQAPIAGAFYAFELVIGTYTIAALAPVMVACIAATFISGWLTDSHGSQLGGLPSIDLDMFVALMGLAVVTAICSVALMLLVSQTEKLFGKLRIPSLVRPIFGGAVLAFAVAFAPFVLSSGHGAMQSLLEDPPTSLWLLLFMIVVKMLASAVSLGSGFRGGLFFASLFVGALIGLAYFMVLDRIAPGMIADNRIAAFAGMTGLAAAVVGGPLTMVFLTLEDSGSLSLAITMLAVAAVSSVLIRQFFGYSFATWRFHQRGETIRSAHDIGLIRSLTVGRMMRRDIRTARVGLTVRTFRRDFPLGSAKQVVVVDDDGAYVGMALMPEIYALDEEMLDQPLEDFLALKETALTPEMTARQAAQQFEDQASDALVVVTDRRSNHVLGILSESYVLRRYAEELDKVRMDMSGVIRRPARSAGRR
ncbi:chloride channel protein [Martelella limonii]|uniref:chloride channel protein n=1 Tax=Martelella limonii TaxID=1647649 RepID=UPI001580D128